MTNASVGLGDVLTVAYIAIGLFAGLRSGWKAEVASGISMSVPDGGELELVSDVIQHTAMLDHLYEACAEAPACVFVHDVAKSFGEQYMAALLHGVRPNSGLLAAWLIAAECVKNGAVETEPSA